MPCPGAKTPWKITEQGSPYNMHISTMWFFFVQALGQFRIANIHVYSIVSIMLNQKEMQCVI
jgi:hypothetical protein